MKIVKLLFNGLGYNSINQAAVNIYSLNNVLLCKTKTYNGHLTIKLKCNCFYRIVAFRKNETINKVIYVDNTSDTIYFTFNNSLIDNNFNIVTFKLTDNNYKDLLIEKGKLFLWLKQ